MSDAEPKRFSLEAALEQMRSIQDRKPGQELRIVIRKSNPGGLSAHQTVEVEGIYAGFDWEDGRVVIVPAKPLTELSQEDVLAIHDSVRKGSSWHSYQRERKLLDRIKVLEEELGAARAAQVG